MTYMEYQIRKLPYSVQKKLADSLNNPSGPRNWKSLISVMPNNMYSPEEVSSFEMEAMRMGGHSANALLIDLGQRCKTVRQLVAWLKKIGNDRALDILEYHEEVQITEQPRSQPVRAGGSATLRCKAIGYPTPQYQWAKDGAALPDGVDEELTIECVEMSDSGRYKCTVSNRFNAEESNTVELQVLPSPVPNVTNAGHIKPPQAKNPPVIIQHPQSCYVPVGHRFNLQCEVLESPVAYQWYKDGFVLSGHFRAYHTDKTGSINFEAPLSCASCEERARTKARPVRVRLLITGPIWQTDQIKRGSMPSASTADRYWR